MADEIQDEVSLTADDMAVIAELNGEKPADDATPVADATGAQEVAEETVDTSTEFTDVQAEQARAYGLDVKLFENREQFEQKILDIDKRWAEHAAMQRWMQTQQPAQAPAQAAPVPPPGQPVPVEVPFKLNLNTDEYPPELIEQVNTAFQQIHEYYSPLQNQVRELQQFAEQQRFHAEQAKQAEIFNEFHHSVQSLQHKQLFGDDPATLNQEQALNVRKLYDHASALADGYAMRGMQVPPMGELVRRAERIAFEKELDTYKSQTRNARLAKQAGQKLGSGGRSASFQPRGDWDGDTVDNPVLKDAWERMIAEQGAR
jgi:hypothetical protein